ncbi:alanine/glycine:cation symporter family protein [Nocardiopsis chromatogenes]|uniref:alanine/glycine:cation symporter family protein n=1 Tax=Nocardiopsis chromatogenes TaxID=280239 RepID=UPI00034623B5|nr:alanine/glycine:cation symporter family protein [Nocardiopsis chromatogenes]
MDALNDAIVSVNDVFWGYLLIPFLLILAVYFTVRSGAVQVRLFPEMFRVLRGQPPAAADGKKAISSFQAFAISAASRVGTGNIVGVATAIALGGPGAVFWMWLMALLVGSAAFVESTLAQLFKVRDRTGFRGGPAYYMQFGLGARWMGLIFAVVITVTFGFIFNSVQANSIADAIDSSVAAVGVQTGPGLLWGVGVALAILVAAVIFGGVRRIAHVAQLLVPFMALAYLVIGLVVVAMNLSEVPRVLGDIVSGAFGVREFVSGGIGAAIVQGMRRGMFSNEAGLGSAPNAGATAAVSHPVKQGLVQTLGVYFDTLLICSITAFIVLVANPSYGEREGASLTQASLEANLGVWAVHALTVILFLLAFTSVLGNYYYGESNLRFMSASTGVVNGYRVLVLAMVLAGAVAPLDLVWTMADVFQGVMATINLIAIAPLAGIAFLLLRDYTAQRKEGRDPVFTRDRLPGVAGVQCWESETDLAPAPGDRL